MLPERPQDVPGVACAYVPGRLPPRPPGCHPQDERHTPGWMRQGLFRGEERRDRGLSGQSAPSLAAEPPGHGARGAQGLQVLQLQAGASSWLPRAARCRLGAQGQLRHFGAAQALSPGLSGRRLGSFGSCGASSVGCCRGGFSDVAEAPWQGPPSSGRAQRHPMLNRKAFQSAQRASRATGNSSADEEALTYSPPCLAGRPAIPCWGFQLFGELVDTQFCHFSPCSGTSRTEGSITDIAGSSSLGTHQVPMGFQPAFATRCPAPCAPARQGP